MIFGIGQPELASGDAFYCKGPDVIRVAQEVAALGANSIRMSAAWMYLDPYNTKIYRWANLDRAVNAVRAVGLDILLTIEPRTRSNAADFGLLCAAIAQRYGDAIAWFEIGNEVNGFGNSVSPHDPAKFVEFLNEAWANITPYVPSALIFAAALEAVPSGWASLSPIEWTQGFIAANGQNYCHALSMHPYMRNGHDYTPQVPTADNWSLQNITALRTMLDNAGATGTLIACTEWGFESMTSPSGLSTTAAQLEAEQAANVEAQWNLLKPYADAGTIYDITWPFMYRDWQQANNKAGYHYGMVHFDYTPKAEKATVQAFAMPWSGGVDEVVGITDTASFVVRPPGLFAPATDSVGIADTASLAIASAGAAHVSSGGGNRSTTVGLEIIITWTHLIASVANGALACGLEVSTDHLKDWTLYNTLTVTSSIDGPLTRLASRFIDDSTVKKGSVHDFGLANSDLTAKQPSLGTHTMTAHVKLNSDGVTSLTAVAANSDFYEGISAFGPVTFSASSTSGTPALTANSAVGNIVRWVFGGSSDFAPTFNQTTRYHAGSTVDGDGDYALIGDAPGANTVTGKATLSLVRYGAVATNLIPA